jgi:hypothetical protein
MLHSSTTFFFQPEIFFLFSYLFHSVRRARCYTCFEFNFLMVKKFRIDSVVAWEVRSNEKRTNEEYSNNILPSGKKTWSVYARRVHMLLILCLSDWLTSGAVTIFQSSFFFSSFLLHWLFASRVAYINTYVFFYSFIHSFIHHILIFRFDQRTRETCEKEAL